MTEICLSDETSDWDCLKFECDEKLSIELEKFPYILAFVHKLQEQIARQSKKIARLQNKLRKSKQANLSTAKRVLVAAEVQTELFPCVENPAASRDWDTISGSGSIVDRVKEAAESAVRQTGFVYEETSGLYYDYNSGYYYDASQGLYYDGNSGTYYVYDEETKSHKFHSRACVPASDTPDDQQKFEKTDDKTAKRTNKDKATKKRKASGDELEEGECSDSVSNSNNSRDPSPERLLSNESDSEEDQDLAKTYPPCMRIIVRETNLPKLKVGSLFVVAYTGGTLGREGDHSVIIPDLNISKHHARFQYDEDKKQYFIVDSGSRNGTILNGKRLSVAKQESEPCEVAHGSILQFGGTKLLCHIHNGHETCGHCEPGLVQKRPSPITIVATKKDQYKTELRRLKSKFGVEKYDGESASQPASGYQDRAQARREHVGSSNHHVKTQQSSVDTSIAKDNKGFKLLSKMGWSEGQSLGKDGQGRTEPVPLLSKHSKAGFGASEVPATELEVDPSIKKKQKIWRKTQKRYNELSD